MTDKPSRRKPTSPDGVSVPPDDLREAYAMIEAHNVAVAAQRIAEPHPIGRGPRQAPPPVPYDVNRTITELWLQLDEIAGESREHSGIEAQRRQAHRSLAAVVGWMFEHPLLGERDLILPLLMLSKAISSPAGERHPIITPPKTTKGGRRTKADTADRIFIRHVLTAVILKNRADSNFKAVCQEVSDDLHVRGHAVAQPTIYDWSVKYSDILALARSDADVLLPNGSAEAAAIDEAVGSLFSTTLLGMLNT